jgi:hypothetical protein
MGATDEAIRRYPAHKMAAFATFGGVHGYNTRFRHSNQKVIP